jgi:hypothetical protein
MVSASCLSTLSAPPREKVKMRSAAGVCDWLTFSTVWSTIEAAPSLPRYRTSITFGFIQPPRGCFTWLIRFMSLRIDTPLSAEDYVQRPNNSASSLDASQPIKLP